MISSFHFASVCEENQSPFWNEAHNDWDYNNPADQPAEVDSTGAPNPPLNGFVFTAAYDARGNGFQDVNGVRAMGYYEGSDLNYYYDRATKFGTSDRWFSPVMDRTQINRMYILAATSQASSTESYAYPRAQTLTTMRHSEPRLFFRRCKMRILHGGFTLIRAVLSTLILASLAPAKLARLSTSVLHGTPM